MVLPLVLALTISAQSLSVVDYFPVAPGTKWTFSQDSDGTKNGVIYEALPPVKIGKQMAIPMEQSTGGSDSTFYYQVGEQSLLLVAIDPKDPFGDARPLIRLNTPSNKWRFDYTQQSESINVDAELQQIGKRNVLGTDRNALMVTMHVKIGNNAQLKITQTTYYAQGVGMYLIDSEQSMGTSHHRSTQTLTKFEAGISK